MNFVTIILLYVNLTALSVKSALPSTTFFTLFQLECDTPDSLTCRNGGLCVDLSKLVITKFNTPIQRCHCKTGFYGPNCDYKNEILEYFFEQKTDERIEITHTRRNSRRRRY